MIEQIKKSLTLIFLSIISTFNGLLLFTLYIFMDYGITNTAKEHIVEMTETEFMPHYKDSDFDTLKKIINDEHFEVLNRQGDVTLNVQSSVHYNPGLNKSHFEAALSGRRVFEIIKQKNVNYLVAYSTLDRDHVLRVTMSMVELSDLRRNFMIIIFLTIPVMLILSYMLSRYMVTQSLKPIIKVLTYQEAFSSNVTHELNTPLTSIKGNLEVLLRKERPSDEYRNTAKSVLLKVNGIIDLLNNLNLLATSKFKPLDLFKENVNMGKFIEELIDEYEPSIISKQIKLKINVQPGVSCECDASILRRAIENLFDNAAKYTPANGVIEIRVFRDNSGCELIISNTCEGVTKDEIDNFFKPFYRGWNKSNTDVQGQGLGLYIIQYIIDSHGGSISVNLDNDILSFTIKIPAV